MEKELTEPSIRAFVALSLSNEVMEVLTQKSLALQRQFADLNIRWVPFKNYHLTLSFIGNIPLHEIDRLETVVKKSISGFVTFTLTIGDIILFPPDQEVKGLFVADVVLEEPLEKLQAKIEADLRAAGYKIYDRPYRPHITIARLRKNRVGEEELTKGGFSLFSPVDHVHIYESHKENGIVVNSIVRSCPLDHEV
ncbi:MAG: RNA 2',3'-cyclic phosphodiesterase [Alphaproteobacteria bacterium]|nr:RNA 2',3'-cyclic phosphodiesterase [Alphaproteobacteria bacterium]HPF47011.1 RNA 2',3'-cyclic phosphodiesterase [Emcibacteraceae bacterium]HRW29648.1 RNA 2',3'-cyclic phosphodiesterase [Emcibacteraceae bacterium]